LGKIKNEVVPYGECDPLGSIITNDLGVSFFRQLTLKGHTFKYFDIYQYCKHELGHGNLFSPYKYLDAELHAIDYLANNYGMRLYNTNDAQNFYSIGHAFHNKGELDIAMVFFHKAIEAKPDFAEAYNNLGAILVNKRKLDDALPFVQRAVNLNPNNAEAYFNLGVILREKGQIEKSLECYERAAQLNPNIH
jgi:tetratricopeptide (TPR) repeat protein